MSLEVVAFVPHSEAGASGRYRVYQMAPALEEQGIRIEIRPFLEPAEVARLYDRGRVLTKFADLMRGAARRWSALGAAGRYRVALIHRELWPVVGRYPIPRLARHQPRWVYDFDDAVWLPNVSEANRAFAWLKPFDQPARLVQGARAVAAGNAFLADWARGKAGRSARVEVIPTAVDTRRWSPRPRAPGPPRLVWIGTPSTAHHLAVRTDALRRLAARHAGLEVHVIGARVGDGAPFVHHPWSLETEVDLVAGADLGLAPMPDDPWTRGKCGLKVLLYMACGLPVVASRAGVHPEMIEDGGNGRFADDDASFEAAIDALLGDPPARARMGAAARETVERRYSVRAVAPRLGALLRHAAEAA